MGLHGRTTFKVILRRRELDSIDWG